MKNEQLIDITETARFAPQNHAPMRCHVAVANCTKRARRVRVELPRHERCLTRRHLITALRQAELSDWLASGGDYLNSMHQPVYGVLNESVAVSD